MVKKAKLDKLKSGVETIFIKNSKTVLMLKKHGAESQRYPEDTRSIFFRVEIEKEIECPAEYTGYENGWYVEN
jgi:hypothetical protein